MQEILTIIQLISEEELTWYYHTDLPTTHYLLMNCHEFILFQGMFHNGSNYIWNGSIGKILIDKEVSFETQLIPV